MARKLTNALVFPGRSRGASPRKVLDAGFQTTVTPIRGRNPSTTPNIAYSAGGNPGRNGGGSVINSTPAR